MLCHRWVGSFQIPSTNDDNRQKCARESVRGQAAQFNEIVLEITRSNATEKCPTRINASHLHRRTTHPFSLEHGRRDRSEVRHSTDVPAHNETRPSRSFSSELLGRLHYIIDDAFGDLIDKEIEQSTSTNASMKKTKQQTNKSKLEHQSTAVISQRIGETREFASFRTDVLRRFQSHLSHLLENFDEEFPVTLGSSPSDSLVIDHGKITGTTFELSDIAEHRHSKGAGGESSAYNISYGSDSENSFTHGSSERHVRLRRPASRRRVLLIFAENADVLRR